MTSPVLVLVTDIRWSLARIATVVEAAGSALPSGTFAVQLRDKTASLVTLAETARTLRDATARVKALLLINAPTPDVVHLAADVGADGVHVPCHPDALAGARARLGAEAWLSTPAHADDDVRIARDAGATAVLVSPIFETPGKGAPRGVAALASAHALAPELVVIALGGIDASRAPSCAAEGAHGVAVIRALLDSDDPARAARALAAPFRPAPRP